MIYSDKAIAAQVASIHELIVNGDLDIKQVGDLEDYGIPREAILKYFEIYKSTISEEDVAFFKMNSALK